LVNPSADFDENWLEPPQYVVGRLEFEGRLQSRFSGRPHF